MVYKTLIAVILFSLCADTYASNKLANLLDKHQQTLGNLRAWQKVKNVTYNIKIKEPEFEVYGIYRATRSGKMRIDIFSDGKRVFTEAYNGTIGWQWSTQLKAVKIIDGEKAAALRHGVELPGRFFTLLDMEQQGHQLEYIGEEKRESGKAAVILLTLKDGHRKYYLLDPHSGQQIANRDTRAFHPDIDPTRVIVETRPSQYKKIEGMRRAWQSDNFDLSNNQWLGTSRVLDIDINSEIDESIFEPSNAVSE